MNRLLYFSKYLKILEEFILDAGESPSDWIRPGANMMEELELLDQGNNF